jgi:hypothetical protein
LQEIRLALSPRQHIIDLEGDADAEQDRQRDDIGIVDWKVQQGADFQGCGCRDQKRQQRQHDVPGPAQDDPKQDRNRAQCP